MVFPDGARNPGVFVHQEESVKMDNICLSPIRVWCLMFGSMHFLIVDCEMCYESIGNQGWWG